MADLLTNATTDQTGPVVPWTGGPGTLFIRGQIRRPTTVHLEVEKHGEWVAATGRLSMSSRGQEDFILGANCNLRARLSGAVANTNVTASIEYA